tara:strand:- start:151 stop:636 length:486 start_codon:yes stop_codon:yes gene_type:complete
MNNFFDKIYKNLESQKLNIIDSNLNKPWGGFFVISEENKKQFSDLYFKEEIIDNLIFSKKISPKILIISPNKRLSWQYHHRRSELWKVLNGKIKVITSHDNLERKEIYLKKGDRIMLNQEERHRIIGTNDYAVVAELWIHTDKDNPSDEDDIVRLQDDFDR